MQLNSTSCLGFMMLLYFIEYFFILLWMLLDEYFFILLWMLLESTMYIHVCIRCFMCKCNPPFVKFFSFQIIPRINPLLTSLMGTKRPWLLLINVKHFSQISPLCPFRIKVRKSQAVRMQRKSKNI